MSESTGKVVAKLAFHFYSTGRPDEMTMYSESIIPVLFDPITENVRDLIRYFGDKNSDCTYDRMLEKIGEDERAKII